MYGPYLQLFSLNNGYRFFAPDPGPGHLIRYELLDDSDNIVESGQFPDRDKHWPRLMYHRNFMISEMAFQLASAVPELPPDILPDQRLSRSDQEMIEKQKQRSLSLQQAIADYYLARQPQATHVRLYGLTHAIPTPLDMDRGTELSDPKLYQEVMLGDFKRQAP